MSVPTSTQRNPVFLFEELYNDVLRVIFDYLQESAAVCLGLTSRHFYALLKKVHSAPISLGTPVCSDCNNFPCPYHRLWLPNLLNFSPSYTRHWGEVDPHRRYTYLVPKHQFIYSELWAQRTKSQKKALGRQQFAKLMSEGQLSVHGNTSFEGDEVPTSACK